MSVHSLRLYVGHQQPLFSVFTLEEYVQIGYYRNIYKIYRPTYDAYYTQIIESNLHVNIIILT